MIDELIKYLKNINELILFKHTIFALPFILIAMIVTADGWFGSDILLYCLIVAFAARNFAMSFNRLVDMDYDKTNERTKSRPSADGRLTKFNIKIFISINALFFVLFSFLISTLAFYLSFPFLIILGGYSYFKRFSSLSHLVLGLSLGLAPIAGSIAVLNYVPLYIFFLAIGVMFWVAGFDLLFSLQDMDVDKKMGLYSVPARYGVKVTLNLSLLFHILTIVFWTLFVIFAHLHFFSYLAVFLSLIILVSEQLLVRKDFKNIPKAFFTLNGYLSIMFFIMIVIDEIVF